MEETKHICPSCRGTGLKTDEIATYAESCKNCEGIGYTVLGKQPFNFKSLF